MARSRGLGDVYKRQVHYLATQYPARQALQLLIRLSKVVGKPLGILTAQTDDEQTKKNLIGEAIDALTQKIEADETLNLVEQILKCVTIFDGDTNRQIIFDIDFQGRLGHLFKLLKEVLSFQYADFLGDLAAITPKMAASKKENGRIKAL
jgi:hypothetical protein